MRHTIMLDMQILRANARKRYLHNCIPLMLFNWLWLLNQTEIPISDVIG